MTINKSRDQKPSFKEAYSPFFALPAGFKPRKKSILKMQVTKTTLTLKMQVTKTTLTLRSGWFWLPAFPILIFESWKPASNAKMVNMNLLSCTQKLAIENDYQLLLPRK